LKTRYRVRTRRAVYLLNRLTRAGVSVDWIERDEETVSFYATVREAKAVETVLTEEGLEYEVGGFRGGRMLFRRIFARPFLLFSVVLTLIAVLFFDGFVYDVTIYGNRYVNTSEIMSVLYKNRVDGFASKSELDLPGIKREIVALDGISFASVKVVGTRLEVEVKESLPPTLPDPADFVPILSSSSAVVTRVIAESGTPRVRSGDRVEAGTLLIDPIYDFTEGASPAPARGEVWGMVTHVREILLPAVSVEPILTGERVVSRSVSFFGRDLGEIVPSPYAEYESEERILYLGFGVTIREVTYREIARLPICHDFDLEGKSVLEKAVSELLLSIPCDAIPRGGVRVTQKRLDNMLCTVLYYTTEQRIDSLSLVP